MKLTIEQFISRNRKKNQYLTQVSTKKYLTNSYQRFFANRLFCPVEFIAEKTQANPLTVKLRQRQHKNKRKVKIRYRKDKSPIICQLSTKQLKSYYTANLCNDILHFLVLTSKQEDINELIEAGAIFYEWMVRSKIFDQLDNISGALAPLLFYITKINFKLDTIKEIQKIIFQYVKSQKK